jgi:hypothetical protein
MPKLLTGDEYYGTDEQRFPQRARKAEAKLAEVAKLVLPSSAPVTAQHDSSLLCKNQSGPPEPTFPPCPKNITQARHESLFLIAVELTRDLPRWKNGELRKRYERKHSMNIGPDYVKHWLSMGSRAPQAQRFLLRRGKGCNTDYAVSPAWMQNSKI